MPPKVNNALTKTKRGVEMFFKSYKQKSFETGTQIRMIVETPFFAERMRAKKENREFLLPKEMFADAYVVGFFAHFVPIMLNFFVCGGNARNWSRAKIGTATMRAFDAIDPTGNLAQQSAMSTRNGVKGSQAYLDGGEAAATLYYCIGKSGLTTDWASVNFSKNILEEASAAERDMGESPSSSTDFTSQARAVLTVTLMRRLNYLGILEN